MDIAYLEKIGLTKNESKIYVSLLETGSSTTGTILKKSQINSGKIYNILESLKQKGLIAQAVINNTKYFTAAPPKELLTYIENKEKEIMKEKDMLKEIIPHLEKQNKEENIEPSSYTFTGFKGFRTLIEEATKELKKGEEVLAMGITSFKSEKYDEFWINWGENRLSKEIKVKYIFSDKEEHYKETKKLKRTNCRVLEGINPVTIDIFGKDKVIILNYPGEVFTLIKDKNTATSFISFFNQLWQQAKS